MKRQELQEDPINEMRIVNHLKAQTTRLLNQHYNDGEIIGSLYGHGLLPPLRMLSNASQQGLSYQEQEWFVVSQLANGGDLHDFIHNENETNRPENERIENVIKIFKKMVKSVSSLHDLNVFHRDVSPENFVLHNVNGGGQGVYLIDYGQARIVDYEVEKITTIGVFGKDAYFAPEVVDLQFKQRHWEKVDVWSLGITFFYMLFGRLPHWCSTAVEITTPEGNTIRKQKAQRTDIYCPVFQAVCVRGGLEVLVRDAFKSEFLPVHKLLQKMLIKDPERRCSIDDILKDECLTEFN